GAAPAQQFRRYREGALTSAATECVGGGMLDQEQQVVRATAIESLEPKFALQPEHGVVVAPAEIDHLENVAHGTGLAASRRAPIARRHAASRPSTPTTSSAVCPPSPRANSVTTMPTVKPPSTPTTARAKRRQVDATVRSSSQQTSPVTMMPAVKP